MWWTFLISLCFASVQSGPIQGWDLRTQKSIEIPATSTARAVVFLSAKCPCSNSHVEHLNELQKKYPQVQFVGIHSNSDENKDDSVTYFSNRGFSYPVLHDANGQWADELKALKTPHAYLISPQGEILFHGGVTSSNDAKRAKEFFLRDALQAFASNKEISKKEARALGCAITRDGDNKDVWK